MTSYLRLIVLIVGIAAAIAGTFWAIGFFTSPERHVNDDNRAAWAFFTELEAAEQAAAKTGDAFNLADYDTKVPAGLAAYASGANYEPSVKYDYEGRYIIAVVNLATDDVFVSQWPHGGQQFFDSVDEFNEKWDWVEYGNSQPKIHSLPGAVGEQIERAQSVYFDAHGTYAGADELVAFSQRSDNLAPDLSPVAGVTFRISHDDYGFIAAVTTDSSPMVISASSYRGGFVWDSVSDYARTVTEGPNPYGETAEPSENVPRPDGVGDDWRVPPVALPRLD